MQKPDLLEYETHNAPYRSILAACKGGCRPPGWQCGRLAQHEQPVEQLQREGEAAEAGADQQEEPLPPPAPAEDVWAAREQLECRTAQDPAAADAADDALAVGRRSERAQGRPARGVDAEGESGGESENGPRAPRAVVLAAQQPALFCTLPAKRAAQLHAEHASLLAAIRPEAAVHSAPAPTRDRVATVASTVAAALVAAGLDAAQAAQIAQRAALEAGQQTMPVAAAASAVLAAELPAEVAASDIHRRPFPSLRSLASLQEVWDLMNNGINGRPSLLSLEDASKNKWRKGRNAKETQNYKQQWETLKAFVAEVSARADKSAEEMHSARSPNKIIAQMDASREANRKPVATIVKQIARECKDRLRRRLQHHQQQCKTSACGRFNS